MRVGLKVNQQHLAWSELRARVRFAEDAGFDGAWLFDHFKPTDGDPLGPCLEGWTLLAGLAASTDRIRLGVMVTGITYRHPSILGAQAVTVDHVSGGRLELALGSAWFEQEHRELGIGFPGTSERIERLEEGVQVIRSLMTEDAARVEGRYYRLEGATYRPRPVQRPHPPIWIGAGGERLMIPLATRVADVWHCFEELEDLPRKIRIFEEHAERAGRDPTSILRAANLSIDGPREDVVDRAAALRDLGFGYVVVPWPSGGRETVDHFVREVMPRLAD
jgi:F420-dependent oxidoreductase-like protein